jgi:nucleotide-binding universal stress UspA family protein
MFKRILIATDLSESSDAVIHCMSNFKSLGVEEVILFYACGIKYLDTIAADIKNAVEPDLKRQQKTIEAQGFKTTIEIAPGFPSEELKKLAIQKDVSLIIIGSQGESAATHLLFRFGGVTSEILHSHEKPLLMVRTKVVEKDGVRKVESLCKNLKERILFATDLSDITTKTFDYLLRLVENGCKKVTLLHVQDKTKIEKYLSEKLEDFNRIDNARLETRRQILLKRGVEEVDIKILYGIPSKEILIESTYGYSLIIMGSQGRGFFKEIFIGSVSHNVARNADASILLIPSSER